MKSWLLGAACAALVFVLSCGSQSGDSSGNGLSIGVIPKGTTHEFWKSIHAGAIKAKQDPEAGRQDQQFMLGPNVLVAPVVSPGTDGRDVYFPRGCWQHPETKETVLGPQTKFILAAVDELPYFFSCGTQPFPVPEGGF